MRGEAVITRRENRIVHPLLYLNQSSLQHLQEGNACRQQHAQGFEFPYSSTSVHYCTPSALSSLERISPFGYFSALHAALEFTKINSFTAFSRPLRFDLLIDQRSRQR
jgi:hypothetical protein